MMASDDSVERARYAALLQLVQALPRADWIEEIRRIETAHPEWVSGWIPPPPIVPPPPPPPSSTATPPPPPAASAPPSAAKPLEPGKRIPIDLDEDKMAEIVEKTLTVLGARLRVFRSAGYLLEVQFDPAKDVKYLSREIQTPRMVAISSVRARLIAAEECSFGRAKFDKNGTLSTISCFPPDWLGPMLVNCANSHHIPPITGLAQAPTLRVDGGLIKEHGYDVSTGIYLAREIPVTVPEYPTKEDAQRAVTYLTDLVSDFDFVNDANRSTWIAGVLSVTCRHTFNGPAPLFVIDASRRGSGKTMLADLASIIATGQAAPRMHFTDDDTEMDKRITSLGIGGETFALIDNIVGKFASAPLDAALTSTTYKGRILGKIEMSAALPMNIVWFATGNGMVLGHDMARRALVVRLEPSVDHPEDRAGPRPGQTWKHPNLIEHTKRERATYLTSALTIVKAYILAGRPKLGLVPLGSFESWSNTIRSALVWAGAADPCATLEQAREADVSDYEARRAVECWPVPDNVEVTAAVLVALAGAMTPNNDSPAFSVFNNTKGATREMWRNALRDWLPTKGSDLPSARDLGYALRKLRNTVCGDFRVESGKHSMHGVPWRRVRMTPKMVDFVSQETQTKTPVSNL